MQIVTWLRNVSDKSWKVGCPLKYMGIRLRTGFSPTSNSETINKLTGHIYMYKQLYIVPSLSLLSTQWAPKVSWGLLFVGKRWMLILASSTSPRPLGLAKPGTPLLFIGNKSTNWNEATASKWKTTWERKRDKLECACTYTCSLEHWVTCRLQKMKMHWSTEPLPQLKCVAWMHI